MPTFERAIAAVLLLLLTACSTSAQPPGPQAPQSATDVVATVGSISVTLGQVDERAMRQSAGSFGGLTLAQALYEARRSALEDIIGNHLLDLEATSGGIDRATLVNREITAKVMAPTEIEIAAWYKANEARAQGTPLDQVRTPISALLVQERTQAARQRYLDALRAKTAVTVALDPQRLKVEAAGRPATGPADAPVEMIEFSDFQCPYCQRVHATLAQVLKTYGDRIHFVYRHYPLPNHPNARPAAEASGCAAEQGQFWPYHDRLFANTASLADADLKRHAVELGLDSSRFNACFDGRKYQADVDADLAAGEAAGVSGTPAFFINGRPLAGAQPFEAFKRIIDEELAK